MIGATRIPSMRLAAFAVSGFAATTAVSSRQVAYAEDKPASFSDSTYFNRKPIYDDSEVSSPKPVSSTVIPPPVDAPTPPTKSSSFFQLSRPKVLDSLPELPCTAELTNQLAGEIKHVRLSLYNLAGQAEDKTNESISRVFRLETRVSDRIAALAPAPGSQERVGSGLLTIAVAAMGTSIFTRNRNILLRSTLPFAVALATANYVVPETMSNLNNLILDIEGRVSPDLRRNHEAATDRACQFIATAKAHSRMGVDMMEDKIASARLGLAEWVQGRDK